MYRIHTCITASVCAVSILFNFMSNSHSIYLYDVDALQLKNMNTQFVGGVAYPATKTLADHNNTTAFKAYIEKYYPASAPQKLQIQSGTTTTVTGNVHATGNITYGGTTLTIGDDSTDTANFFADFHDI